MKRIIFSMIFVVSGCAHAPFDSQPMPKVDAARYMGKWYEIARLPNRFEKRCEGVTADYELGKDGVVKVVNTCHEGAPNGVARTAVAKAWIVHESNSRLEVSFWWPFKAPYWIIDLDSEYQWAVVGHPKRKYLWILARQKSLPAGVETGVLARLTALGYDVAKLERPRQ